MLDFKFQQHEAQPAIGLSISTRLGYPISLYVDDYRLGAGGALRDLDPVFTAADVVPRIVEKRYAVPNKGRCINLMVFLFVSFRFVSNSILLTGSLSLITIKIFEKASIKRCKNTT